MHHKEMGSFSTHQYRHPDQLNQPQVQASLDEQSPIVNLPSVWIARISEMTTDSTLGVEDQDHTNTAMDLRQQPDQETVDS